MPTTDEKTRKLAALDSYQQLPPKLRSLVKLAILYGIDGPTACSVLNLPNPTRTWESEKVQRVVAQYGGADLETDYLALLEAVKDTDEAVPALEQKTGTSAPSTELRPSISSPSAEGQNPPQSNQALTDGQNQPVSGQTTAQPLDFAQMAREAVREAGKLYPDVPAPVTRPGDPPGMVVPPSPVVTAKACAVCRNRLAWYDGVTCGPCAGNPPTSNDLTGPTDGDPNSFDLGALFPRLNEMLPSGLTGLETWRQQQRDDADERDRLVGELIEQRQREQEQNDNDISRITHSSRLVGRR